MQSSSTAEVTLGFPRGLTRYQWTVFLVVWAGWALDATDSSAVLVAISQAFVYASLAVAPLMVVTPILQLSLVFRLFLSQWINRDYEVVNTAVFIGAFTAVLGSVLVSLDTDALTALLRVSPALGDFLGYRLAGR